MHQGQSSIDAIDKSSLSKSAQRNVQWYDDPEEYSTAAGIIIVNGELKLKSDAVGDINAKLLDADHSIISVGQRCMELGYDFHWKPYVPPVIARPDGKRFECTVRHFVPYLQEDGGVLCPVTATGGHKSSTSSSSRDPPRDESRQQPAKDDPAVDEAANVAPGDKGEKVETFRKDKNDDVPLMKLEAMSLHHTLTHTHTHQRIHIAKHAKEQRCKGNLTEESLYLSKKGEKPQSSLILLQAITL